MREAATKILDIPQKISDYRIAPKNRDGDYLYCERQRHAADLPDLPISPTNRIKICRYNRGIQGDGNAKAAVLGIALAVKVARISNLSAIA